MTQFAWKGYIRESVSPKRRQFLVPDRQQQPPQLVDHLVFSTSSRCISEKHHFKILGYHLGDSFCQNPKSPTNWKSNSNPSLNLNLYCHSNLMPSVWYPLDWVCNYIVNVYYSFMFYVAKYIYIKRGIVSVRGVVFCFFLIQNSFVFPPPT